jgi:hypothetical protein
MMLAVSVGSALVAGLIGFSFGTTSLENAEYQRLTQLRESRQRAIATYYESISDAATVLTHSSATIDAVKDFTEAFKELQKTPLPPRATEAVDNYYRTVFSPEFEKESRTKVDVELYTPTTNAQTYLQNAYTVPAKGDFAAALAMTSAGDPSEWSKLNAQYQPFFADFTQRFGFEDTLLLDTEGNIVYSAYKGVDLGANVLQAPYTTTELAEAYRKTMRATSVDEVIFTDLERYAPSYGVPTPWVVTPIGDATGIHGALALQLDLESINNVMTGNRGWEQEGLVLAGPAHRGRLADSAVGLTGTAQPAGPTQQFLCQTGDAAAQLGVAGPRRLPADSADRVHRRQSDLVEDLGHGVWLLDHVDGAFGRQRRVVRGSPRR